MIYMPDNGDVEAIKQFPDLFVSKKTRESKDFIKSINDYFATEARRQYAVNVKTFVRNYKFLKGELTPEDFYEENLDPTTKSFMSDLDYDYERDGLPSDIVHYSILNQPINTLMGELSSKPDNKFVKAFDEQSQAEQLEMMTKIIEDLMYSKIKDKWILKFTEQGLDVNSEEFMQNVQQSTEKEAEEKLGNVTTIAERWGNRMLEALKVQFKVKELSEDTFSDLLKTGRERYHVYQDNSETGFRVENINPKNTFRIQGLESKYLDRDVVTGIIEVKDISEIMEIYSLTKKDIDNLRKDRDGYVRNKTSTKTGLDSITYGPQIDPYLQEVRELEELSLFRSEIDVFDDYVSGGKYWHGDKYQVVTSYTQVKELVGKLTYVDSEGIETADYVGEEYKSGDHPGEIDLEWRYYNRWYKGVNIANRLYSFEPVGFLERNPIVGGDFDPRNSEVKGLLDLGKPLQMIYTLAANQLWRLLQKEVGIAYALNPRKIPLSADGLHEEALDDYMEVLRNQGISQEDDSPENMGTPGNQQSASKVIDLTRTAEIQSRWNLMQQMKMECWEVLGFSRERLGSVAASQTAQGTQVSVSQSFAQTAPWFNHHYYILNDLYQTMLDAAQYFESQKEESTISYVSGMAENVFVKIAGSDLKLRDLKVFVTDRVEDFEQLQRMGAFTNEMLQNGVSAYDVSLMMDSKSIRMKQDVLRKIKERQEEFQNREQEIKQQQNQAIAQQTEAMQQIEQARIDNTNMNLQLDRESKERIATINTYSRQESNLGDGDNNGIPDIMDLLRDNRESEKIQQDNTFRLAESQSRNSLDTMKIASNNRKLVISEKMHKDKMDQLEAERISREKIKMMEVKIAKTNKN